MGPLVSVVIPTYNRAGYVVGALESVLKQTYRPMEVLVVDDGSTDDTKERLGKYDGDIRYIYQERGERSKARNVGIKSARGDYIAFLDSDDLWLPEKLEKQVAVFLREPGVGLVYTDVDFIDEAAEPYRGEIHWDEPLRRDIYEDLMTRNVITGSLSSILVAKFCFEKAGMFDEHMNLCEDLDLYRRIARDFKFKKIDLPLVRIRVHGGNTQRQRSTMAKGWQDTIRKVMRNTPPTPG